MTIAIGTAGWAIGTAASDAFPATGSGLERYAALFDVAEINSSFHRPHRLSTWKRWRESVPDGFRFSVKIPKTISHERKLVGCDELLASFLEQAEELGEKLGILLLQLPPKLPFTPELANDFIALLRSRSPVPLACEPRHPSWFEPAADELLTSSGIARVAADPPRHGDGGTPGGWRGLSYFRLHGSPVMYRSSYEDRIGELAERLQAEAADGRVTWCIFDNTASSAAVSDALRLRERLRL